jgi:hypothetical protein
MAFGALVAVLGHAMTSVEAGTFCDAFSTSLQSSMDCSAILMSRSGKSSDGAGHQRLFEDDRRLAGRASPLEPLLNWDGTHACEQQAAAILLKPFGGQPLPVDHYSHEAPHAGLTVLHSLASSQSPICWTARLLRVPKNCSRVGQNSWQ